MANSWQADEEDEFIFKEPTFRQEEPSKSSYFPPRVPMSRTLADVLLVMGLFVATIALGELTSKVISKWLD